MSPPVAAREWMVRMARPRLSLDTFLAHVFSPKKNPRPIGLRRSTLKATAGRKKARVNAFNRMTTVKQNILTYTGDREKYLRGEITFTDAKRRLRTDAVQRKIVKPLRRKYGPSGPNTYQSQTELKRRIADFVWSKVRTLEPTDFQQRLGLPRASRDSIDQNIDLYLTDPDPEILTWDLGDIQEAAKGYEVNGKRYLVFEGASERNPFWYH